MDSANKYCLITGSSRGLGKTLAEHFWQRGWSLILLARGQQVLNEVVRSLGERAGQSLHTIVADLARPEEIERVGETAKSLVPRLDALINNAGIQGAVGPTWENDWNEWLDTLRVDLLAPVALCRLVAPWMIVNGGGSILNLSGGGATGPRANFSAYATAKAGLVRFSETLAEELKPHNIRVNCIAPGAMGTAMLEEIIAKGESAVGKREYETAAHVLREGGASMHRVAELCHFLASDAATGITGKLISAVWDPWPSLPEHLDDLRSSDIYTLRRIVPKDRGKTWGNDK
jgi:NAD(P)-dependent dehydrogenase (short-subunit alcohol dehydrogenase family)